MPRLNNNEINKLFDGVEQQRLDEKEVEYNLMLDAAEAQAAEEYMEYLIAQEQAAIEEEEYYSYYNDLDFYDYDVDYDEGCY